MTACTSVHAELVDRDRELPGLPLLFDPPRLADVLEAHSGVRLSLIEPVYVRYKRRTSCLVGYRINGPMDASYLYVKALRPAASDKLHKAVTRDAVTTWLGHGPVVLQDSAAIAWAHPNDGQLRAVRLTGDHEGRRVLLRRGPADLRESSEVAFQTLSYKPERRFVAELRPAGCALPRAVLKIYTGAGYEQALVRATGVMSRGVLRVPVRLARDRRRHLLFLDWLPGRLAADLVASGDPIGEPMALVGEALAELHNQPVNPSTPPSLAYDSATLMKVVVEVAFLFPRLAHTLEQLSARLSGLDLAQGRPLSPVHGDFHLRQVLVSASTAGFIDFDRAGAGTALGDIACCRAHVEWDVLTGVLSRARGDEVVEALLAGYERGRQRPFSPDLDACTAAALTLLLVEPFRHFRPDASDLTARILDRALALLGHAEARTLVS